MKLCIFAQSGSRHQIVAHLCLIPLEELPELSVSMEWFLGRIMAEVGGPRERSLRGIYEIEHEILDRRLFIQHTLYIT